MDADIFQSMRGSTLRCSGASVAELMVAVDTTLKYPRLYRHKLGTVVIPDDLRACLTRSLKGYSRPALRTNAAVLADVLRRRVRARPSDASAGVIKPRQLLRYDEDQTAVYLAHRVPGIFATAFRVMREARFKAPSLVPTSMLDYGSGPGTAVWAAASVWPDTLKHVVAIEPSLAMQKASEGLLRGLELSVERRRALVLEAEPMRHGVVCASYSLGEFQSPQDKAAEVLKLWSLVAPGGVLILVEPGTPVGFKTIVDARATVLALNRPHVKTPLAEMAHVLAPCPHALACPMPATRWCHFKQRTRKTALQMQTKLNKEVNFNDEKYSYVVLAKGRTDSERTMEGLVRHRVVEQPGKRGGHVVLDTCSAKGVLAQVVVAKSHGSEAYRSARKAYRGDEIFLAHE